MNDAGFDHLCADIQLEIDTDAPILDAFFATEFDAHIGAWVRNHPELAQLKTCFEKHYASNKHLISYLAATA